MKKIVRYTALLLSVTCVFLLSPGKARSQSVIHASGNYCVGVQNAFVFSGSGTVTSWDITGDYTVVSSSGNSIIVVWNAPVTAWVTANYSSITGPLSASLANIPIGVSGTPAVSISASSNNVCEGTSITFTASATGAGTNPSYMWSVNGSSVSGVSGPSYTTSSLANGDQVNCTVFSNASCVTSSSATSNTLTATINSPTIMSVTVSGTSNVCGVTSGSYNAVVTNGPAANTLTYAWMKNGSPVTGLPNTPPQVLALSTINNNDVISCVVSTGVACTPPATSNNFTVNIPPPQPFSAGIGLPAGLNLCQGSTVTFTAGASDLPTSYQWTMNGSSVGTGSSFTTTASSVAQLQSVSLTVTTASSACLTNTTAMASNANVPFTVTPTVTPTVSISSLSDSPTPLTICAGQTVGIQAAATNEGASPSFQWRLNGVDILGADHFNSYLTNGLADGDRIDVVLTSSAACPTTTTASSNVMTFTFASNLGAMPAISGPSAVQQGAYTTYSATTANATDYRWTVTPASAGSIDPHGNMTWYQPFTGTATISVTANGCGGPSAASTLAVTVHAALSGGTVLPGNVTVPAGSDPGTFYASSASGGNCSGNYTYQWQQSTSLNLAFQDIPGQTEDTYRPGNVSATTYYQRKAMCGLDVAYSNIVSVTMGTLSSSNLNYIRTRDITRPGITDLATANSLTDAHDVRQVTQYLDGLGRPFQTVGEKASPLGQDLVTMSMYDLFGNEPYAFLPYVAPSNDGNYKTNPAAEQNNFNTEQFAGEQYYYAKTVFEASPLNRVTANDPAGTSWVGSGRGIMMHYLSNTIDDDVHIWNITLTPGSIPVSAGIYPDGELYKNRTIDEQGHQVVEYKDKEGHVVLKKVQSSTNPTEGHDGWLCTYYVYDNLNNLRFVISPKAVEWLEGNGWTFDASGGDQVATELCFRYEYDARNRMVVKQVPGKGEDWTVYDVRDRQVFTQDANQRSQHQWLNTQYDDLNRTVLVGQMNYMANRVDLQQTVNSLSTTGSISPLLVADLYLLTPNLQGDKVATDAIDMWDGFSTLADGAFSASIVPVGSITSGYPAGSLPVVLNPVPTGVQVQPLIINYYDNYDWVTATGSGLGTSLATDKTGSPNYFITGYNKYPEYAVPIAASPVVRGQVTGMMHLVLNENRPLYIVNFYDDRDRMIQSRSINYTGGTDTATIQYDFNGKPLRSLLTHYKSGVGPQYHSALTKMDYDAGFRLLHVWKNIDGAPSDQLISTQRYNELGQLTSKALGNNLDNLNYNYNIRGWLNSINQDYICSTSSTPLHYFGLQLGYDKSQAGPSGTSFKNFQYNGNISGWIWRSAGDGVNRQYDFTYDNINRLTGADFNQKFPGGWGKSDPSNSALAMDYSVSIPQYDANGNIMKMVQKGFRIGKPVDAIDDLAYQYNANSNKLAGVTDAANDASSKLGDFHYNAATKDATDYSYDVNGNLITDKNKNITRIVYNYLNLPQQITITGKGTISYTYDATGNKLRKTTIDNTITPSKTTVTTYIGGIQYQNDSLQFIGHEEGRARWALHNYTTGATGYGWEYDFFEKDHLGNTRVVLTQQKDTAQYIATMEPAYRAKEMALFYNIDSTSYPASSVPGGFPDIGPPSPNDSVARLSGSPGSYKMGPALLLKVMAGDSVAFGSKYFYHSNATPGPSHSSVQDVMTSLAQGLLSIAGGGHGSLSDLNNTSGSPVYAALNNFLPATDTIGTDKPKAYLNWMLLDNQFNYVADQSGAQQVGSPDILNPPLAQALKLNHSGYLYIWVSNGTENWDVFFDNLAVSHYSGPMVEETHYYPFGLTMAGISDKALKTQYAENKFRFNHGAEFQNKEFLDGSGLEMYDTHFRQLDPQLGRWWQIDPKPHEMLSPYAAMMNNPMQYSDPLGDTTWVFGTKGQYLGTVNDKLKNQVHFVNNDNSKASSFDASKLSAKDAKVLAQTIRSSSIAFIGSKTVASMKSIAAKSDAVGKEIAFTATVGKDREIILKDMPVDEHNYHSYVEIGKQLDKNYSEEQQADFFLVGHIHEGALRNGDIHDGGSDMAEHKWLGEPSNNGDKSDYFPMLYRRGNTSERGQSPAIIGTPYGIVIYGTGTNVTGNAQTGTIIENRVYASDHSYILYQSLKR